MTQARSPLIPFDSDGLYHCIQRRVRHGFPCDEDIRDSPPVEGGLDGTGTVFVGFWRDF